VTLPKMIGNKKKTFVFDVDETLVHCNGLNSGIKSDIEFNV